MILLKPHIESATMKSTRWSATRTWHDELMPSTNDSWLWAILYRACGSTAQSLDSASPLDLGKYNHFREAFMLDVNESDLTTRNWLIRLMTTEGYDRCSQRKLPSMPRHEGKLSTALMIPTMTNAEIYELQLWMVGGVWVWKWRCGGLFLCLLLFASVLFIS
jgi:hypothetical protein